mgnify:CR=1 FL=1
MLLAPLQYQNIQTNNCNFLTLHFSYNKAKKKYLFCRNKKYLKKLIRGNKSEQDDKTVEVN